MSRLCSIWDHLINNEQSTHSMRIALQAELRQPSCGSAFASCGRAVAHVWGSYGPIADLDLGPLGSCLKGIRDHNYYIVAIHVGGRTMSALSQNLHQSIRRALNMARDYHLGEAAPEHLLFAFTDDPEATPVLVACNVDLAKLRDDLLAYVRRASANVSSSIERPRPNIAFQTIVQRAVRHVHSVDQDVVTAAQALVSLFADPVARFLQDQGMTRYDAVSYLCHRIVKHPEPTASARPGSMSEVSAEHKTNGATYEVVLLNDEYTTMAFVVCVVQEVFHVTRDEAVRIMLAVHENGTGSCGYYNRTEAEKLAGRLMDRARGAQHPLRCVVKGAAGPRDLVRAVARAAIMVVPRAYLPSWFERVSGW